MPEPKYKYSKANLLKLLEPYSYAVEGPVGTDKSESNSAATTRPTFEEWYKTIPAEKNDTTGYDLRRAYELAPQEELDAFVNDPAAHLHSTYYNPQTGYQEWMKSTSHPTAWMEYMEYLHSPSFNRKYVPVPDPNHPGYLRYEPRRGKLAYYQGGGKTEETFGLTYAKYAPIMNSTPMGSPGGANLALIETIRKYYGNKEANKYAEDSLKGVVAGGVAGAAAPVVLPALSKFAGKVFAHPIVQGVFGVDGVISVVGKDGVRKTVRKMTDAIRSWRTNSPYKWADTAGAALSGVGDVWDISMINGAYKTGKGMYKLGKQWYKPILQFGK